MAIEPLRATIQHIALIQRQATKLETARREAVAQLEAAAARLGPLPLDHAEELLRELQDGGIRGRLAVLKAVGWHPQQIAAERARREAGVYQADVPCVYLLIQGNEVVYVGRSVNVRARLKAHRIEKHGLWDAYQVFRCDSLDASKDLEAVLIQQHRPPLNDRVERRTVA